MALFTFSSSVWNNVLHDPTVVEVHEAVVLVVAYDSGKFKTSYIFSQN